MAAAASASADTPAATVHEQPVAQGPTGVKSLHKGIEKALFVDSGKEGAKGSKAKGPSDL